MSETITYRPSPDMKESRFSILIPSWNNLEYLKCCVRSIKKNSSFEHEIILHINEGMDDTEKWARSEGLGYSKSETNIGICLGVNAAASLANADYLVYINDDMYVCPDWDRFLWDEIESWGSDLFLLSGTLIEPTFSGNKCVLAPFNYGENLQEFSEERLLNDYKSLPFHDWSGSTWPPIVIHRITWKAVGGLSEEFSPGFYSDPDLSMKLWQIGVRFFKGVSASRIYHFRSKSLGRITPNKGRIQFMRKWKVSASYFYKSVLRMGVIYNGPLPDKKIKPRLIDKIKLLFAR